LSLIAILFFKTKRYAYMKKIYAIQLVSVLALSVMLGLSAAAQGGVYFREGFEEGTGWASAAADAIPFKEVVTTTSGSWYTFGGYRSNGPTGSCQTQTGGLSHVRFANLTSVQPGYTVADSAFLLTPLVNAGVYDISWYNGRASRRVTLYKTTSTDPATTDWTFVQQFPTTNLACDIQTVLVNDATTKRLKIVTRSGTDSDLDSMVMRSVGSLPSRLGESSAQLKKDGVLVSWQASNEVNVKGYFVQRSDDGGITFKDVAFVASYNKLESNYTYNDKGAGTGLVFYRIKGQDLDGRTNYGKVVKLHLNKTEATGVWVVNPVAGRTIELQLNGLQKGIYSIQVIDASGKSVTTKSVNVQSDRMSTSLPLNAGVAKGMYVVSVRGAGTTTNKRVIVE
jgi:hypothetical protein